MSISVGDRLPDVSVKRLTADGPQDISTAEFFAGRKVVLLAVLGAYTGTCNAQVPTYLENADAIKAKGVDEIACIAVNDFCVLDAWEQSLGSAGQITMLADGNGAFTNEIGMALDASAFGFGNRSHRYSMLVDDGEVKAMHVEENPGVCTVTSGAEILGDL